jgi:hypothetical protein
MDEKKKEERTFPGAGDKPNRWKKPVLSLPLFY